MGSEATLTLDMIYGVDRSETQSSQTMMTDENAPRAVECGVYRVVEYHSESVIQWGGEVKHIRKGRRS